MVMIFGLLALVVTLGMATFVPRPLLQVQLRDGRVLMGELSKQDAFTLNADSLIEETPEVQQQLIAGMLQATAQGSGLIDQLEHDAYQLRREETTLQGRMERMRRSVKALEVERTQALNPFDRRRMIRNDPTARKIQEQRTKLVALEQRATALQAEIDSAEQATKFFRGSPTLDADTILQADDLTRHAGINALIALAKQRDESTVRFRRRMLRTGNFELTNEHFNWVADYQIAEGGESRPAAATLVERVAWGRFYGEPRSFTVKEQRHVTNGERELMSLVEFCQTHQPLLASEDEARTMELEDILHKLQHEYVQQRLEATQAFVQKLQQEIQAGQRLEMYTEAGETKSVDELTPDDQVLYGAVTTDDPVGAWREFQRTHAEILDWRRRSRHLEKHELGAQYSRQEAARLRVRQAELDYDVDLLLHANAWLQALTTNASLRDQAEQSAAMVTIARRRYGGTSDIVRWVAQMDAAFRKRLAGQLAEQQATIDSVAAALQEVPEAARREVQRFIDLQGASAEASAAIQAEIRDVQDETSRYELQMVTADGQSKTLAAGDIVRAFQPNQLSRSESLRVYLSRWWEFLTQEPREANSEGGVLPAIWGTIVMTLIMTIAVVPFGVVAALYLREYAKSGPIVSVIRIAINNLAGVPSIVFGVFGLAFFCYIIGAYLDGGPENAGFHPLPPPRWYVALAVLAMTALIAFLCGVYGFSGPPAAQHTEARCGDDRIGWLVASDRTVCLRAAQDSRLPRLLPSQLAESLLGQTRRGVGGAHLGLDDLARGHCRYRRSAVDRPEFHARRLLWLWRQQVADDSSHCASPCVARNHDRHDSGDGSRGRRGLRL